MENKILYQIIIGGIFYFLVSLALYTFFKEPKQILKDFLDFNEDVGLATAKVLDNNGNYSSSYKQFPHLIKQH